MLPDKEFGPWNPGIESQVPRELRHLATIFRAENVFTSIAAAGELHSLTGFNLSELVVFRPQRLALHELLVRITADFAVPDGTRIADLGLNFREIARLTGGAWCRFDPGAAAQLRELLRAAAAYAAGGREALLRLSKTGSSAAKLLGQMK